MDGRAFKILYPSLSINKIFKIRKQNDGLNECARPNKRSISFFAKKLKSRSQTPRKNVTHNLLFLSLVCRVVAKGKYRFHSLD
jgi:hypothetical protein